MLDFLKQKESNEDTMVGKFIVIDGTDGSGKTTQTKMLKETLEIEGYEVVHFKFPQYGKKSAGPAEEYLEGKYGKLNPYTASVLYAVDRFDAGFILRKHLAEGKIILSERYVSSNAGHQGGNIENEEERIKFFKWLDGFEYQTMGIPKPDLTVILSSPARRVPPCGSCFW
jgi:dTMP kinase